MPAELKSTKGCGLCCMEIGRPPYVFDELLFRSSNPITVADIEDFPAGMPEHLKQEVADDLEGVRAGEGVNRQRYFLPCFWLDMETGLCKHYQWRPELCREHNCSTRAGCLIHIRGVLE